MSKTYTACIHRISKNNDNVQIHIVRLEKIPGHFIDITSIPKNFLKLGDDEYYMFHDGEIEKPFFVNDEYVMYSFKKKRKMFLEKIIELEESDCACINDEAFLNKCKNELSKIISSEMQSSC